MTGEAPDTDRTDRTLDEAGAGEPSAREPDISEQDRFFVNGRPLPFQAWVEAVMQPIAYREPAPPEPQPAPESPEVVWMSRRPADR
jgi:hypothetical protein